MDQESIDRETKLIEELDKINVSKMTEEERLLRLVKIKDAYWRRMMAMRTDEEVARGVCAPG